MRAPRRTVVFVHSSNEMFGADRMLLHVVDTLAGHPDLTAEVWLPADVERSADSVQQHLEERGVTTRVLPTPILRRRYLTPAHLPGLIARTATLWWRLLRARPAIVYCATSAALLAAPVARLAGSPRVIMHMQEIWSPSDARVLGTLASACTDIVAISTESASSMPGRLHRRVTTIVNAVADRATPPPTPVDETVGPMRFLVASRWNSWKGHATLLAAWDSLDTPPGQLVIVGSPPELGTAVDVVGLVAALRHPQSVTVVGQVTDTIEWIDRSDVVVMPSDDPEPFGLVAVEAFSRRRPVIASAGGGLGSIVTPGVDGLLFTNRSVAELADALASIDRPRARRMGEAARATFVDRYAIDRFSRQFGELWSR
ncbi:glycosyltransferase family 4 protein [Marisediminicola senii]|uniref:glycosyltransferase family 4 protein n=1 Tax=Marisediminicola senii TaxID=2711233 RepID=UPI0013EB212C|nr:glycosyltransferase family 4 protein [Marisediminicola senii]